jgi:hypothetical protein
VRPGSDRVADVHADRVADVQANRVADHQQEVATDGQADRRAGSGHGERPELQL